MVTIGPLEKLGTIWWFELFDVDTAATDEVAAVLVAEMDRFNTMYARFRPDSVLSQLNERGVCELPSQEFVELLTIAETAYRDTNGVFNIAVGARLEQSGYDATYSFTATTTLSIVPHLADVLTVRPDRVTLRSGARLDFGGFGKGYLIDRLAALLLQWGCTQFLINGGGDMYASERRGKAIDINLQHPLERDRILGSLPLAHCGFAASSPYVRQWSTQGTVRHHLVGNEQAGATFVVAQTAVMADIWATTLAIDATLIPPAGVQCWLWDEHVGLVRQSEAGK